MNNSMVAHVWAQQNTDSGKNGRGSFTFCGSRIYSYAMLIGKFINDNTVLLTSDGYSVTTAKHKNDVNNSLSSWLTVFNVPCLDITINTKHSYTKEKNKKYHKVNLAYFISECNNSILKASRARTNKDFYNSHALKMVDQYNLYIDTFKLRVKKITLPNVEQIKADAIKQKSKIARANKAKIAKIARANKEKITQWLNGERVSVPYSIDVMLRINGDTIETSHNASFPCAHGYLALSIINQCKINKTTFKTNGKVIRLGHFKIDYIDTKGNVKAGCHNVRYSAIERIEAELVKWRMNNKDAK